jgi:hypothetical protein
MQNQQNESCIEACNDCADACDMCAAACLKKDDVKMMARCIALDIDCAQLCRLAAFVTARGSEAASVICQACADVCDMCAEECGKHQMQHCQECAEACRRCAAECRRMGTMGGASATTIGLHHIDMLGEDQLAVYCTNSGQLINRKAELLTF